MTDSTQSPFLTADQIDFVLGDIATHAKQVERMLGVLICGGSDQLPDEAMLIAMMAMVQRMGWAADMAMERSKRSIGPCFGGDAEDWMMPPLFHSSRTANAGG